MTRPLVVWAGAHGAQLALEAREHAVVGQRLAAGEVDAAGRRVAGVHGALVTVGAAQSNHCRMTAAAGARLGLETHLVVSGDRVDHRSDVFSVGACLYELVTNRHPFTGNTEFNTLENIRRLTPPENSRCPAVEKPISCSLNS